jgi:hypothetical protein
MFVTPLFITHYSLHYILEFGGIWISENFGFGIGIRTFRIGISTIFGIGIEKCSGDPDPAEP